MKMTVGHWWNETDTEKQNTWRKIY